MMWWPKTAGRPDGRKRKAPAPDARTLLLAHTSEAEFREYVRGVAERHGWLYYWTWRSDHSPAGFLDLVLARPPRLIIAELKTERGIVSTAQRRWLGALEGCEAVEVYLWRPRDWEAVEAILSRTGSAPAAEVASEEA